MTSGFQITGTWPVRASQKWRILSRGTNALASYVVLACRPRPQDDRGGKLLADLLPPSQQQSKLPSDRPATPVRPATLRTLERAELPLPPGFHTHAVRSDVFRRGLLRMQGLRQTREQHWYPLRDPLFLTALHVAYSPSRLLLDLRCTTGLSLRSLALDESSEAFEILLMNGDQL